MKNSYKERIIVFDVKALMTIIYGIEDKKDPLILTLQSYAKLGIDIKITKEDLFNIRNHAHNHFRGLPVSFSDQTFLSRVWVKSIESTFGRELNFSVSFPHLDHLIQS